MRRKRQRTTLALTCLTFVAALLCSLPAQAAAQNVSITQRSGSLDNVLRQLAQQADVQIVYNTEAARRVRVDNFEVRGQSVEQTLNKALAGTNMSFELRNNIYLVREQQAPQTRSITGRVVDESGRGIVGAGVSVVGTTQGTVTDAQGNFAIRYTGTGNVALQVEHIGRKTTRATWTGTPVTVRLQEQSLQAEGVVVTGVFNKPRESYTGAATLITAEQLDQAGTGTVISRLNIIDPSFYIREDNYAGSDPNAVNMDISMRGNTSVNLVFEDTKDIMRDSRESNLPLFILDEFEVSLQAVMNLDPTQIQSITLLKDAAATALYGSRGANGIVVITKKPPVKGKVSLSYRGDLNVNAPDLSSYNLMNAREKLEYERAAGLYNGGGVAGQAAMDALYSRLRANIERGVNTDWLHFPVRVGIGHTHSVRLEGGDDNMLYAANVSANNSVGVMKGSTKTGVSGNIQLIYTKGKFRMTEELGVNFSQGDGSPYRQFSDWAKMNPYWEPYNEAGFPVKLLNNGTPVDQYLVGNPLYDIDLPYRNRSKSDSYYNNLAMIYTPFTGMRLKADLRLTRGIGTTDMYDDPRSMVKYANTDPEEFARKGSYAFNYSETVINYEGHLSAEYNKTIKDKHQIMGGLRFNINQSRALQNQIKAEGYSPSDLISLGLASAYEKNGRPVSGDATVRSAGLTFNANYTYNSKYYADFSAKMDGNSQFGANKRTAPFWSAGAGWNLHNESFIQNAPWVSRLRVYGNYGTSGSQNFSAYMARTMFQSYFGELYNNLWPGVDMVALGNPNLEWQVTKSLSGGLEVSLWQDRITANANFYNKVTHGVLMDINVPPSSGFPVYKANLGKVRNRGFEIQGSATVLRNREKRFSWIINAVAVQNKNKVLEISNGIEALNDKINSDDKKYANPSFLVKEGESLNTMYVVKSLGIDPSSGRELYEKLDGTHTFFWDPKDKRSYGSPDPKVFGNFGTVVRYQGFALNVAFSYTLGGKTYNETLLNKVEAVSPYYNVDKRVYDDRWKQPGDRARYRDITIFNRAVNSTSRYIMNENTVQCRVIDLSYEPGFEWLQKNLKMSYVKIGLSAQNPFRISTIKQERGTGYPFARTFALSLTARF